MRYFIPLAIVAALVLISVQGAATSPAAVAGPCGLRLGQAVRGELPFRIPLGGRAVRRVLARKLIRCTLERRDGSLFARLRSDARERILEIAFYRRNGALRRATGAVYAQTPSDTGANVKCGSSSQASIGPKFWTQPREWSIGTTPKGVDRGKAIKALRNAMSEWTNGINWCGLKDQASPPMRYMGETTRKAGQDGISVVDWASLESDQDCKGALACTVTAYDQEGNPVEADVRFNTKYKWSTTGAKDAYDIQTVAAHEFGHVLQLDHVTNSSKNDQTVVMWPYLEIGDTSGRKLGRGDALGNNSHY